MTVIDKVAAYCEGEVVVITTSDTPMGRIGNRFIARLTPRTCKNFNDPDWGVLSFSRPTNAELSWWWTESERLKNEIIWAPKQLITGNP